MGLAEPVRHTLRPPTATCPAIDLITKETRIIASGIGDAYGVALDGTGFAFKSAFRDGSVLRINLDTGETSEAAAGIGNPTAMVLSSRATHM